MDVALPERAVEVVDLHIVLVQTRLQLGRGIVQLLLQKRDLQSVLDLGLAHVVIDAVEPTTETNNPGRADAGEDRHPRAVRI